MAKERRAKTKARGKARAWHVRFGARLGSVPFRVGKKGMSAEGKAAKHGNMARASEASQPLSASLGLSRPLGASPCAFCTVRIAARWNPQACVSFFGVLRTSRVRDAASFAGKKQTFDSDEEEASPPKKKAKAGTSEVGAPRANMGWHRRWRNLQTTRMTSESAWLSWAAAVSEWLSGPQSLGIHRIHRIHRICCICCIRWCESVNPIWQVQDPADTEPR